MPDECFTYHYLLLHQPHFIDEETEAQPVRMICPRPASLGSEPQLDCLTPLGLHAPAEQGFVVIIYNLTQRGHSLFKRKYSIASTKLLYKTLCKLVASPTPIFAP